MKIGEVYLHKEWNTPVVLLSKYKSYYEVLVDGEIELLLESEIKKICDLEK